MFNRILGSLLVIIFTTINTFDLHAESAVIKKRIYITTFENKGGIKDSVAAQIRDNIKITILERFGQDYRIITDDDIRIMFKKAEQLQAAGCNDESCNLDIAQSIRADEIIYGNISRESGNIKITAYNLDTGSTARKGAGTKSMVSVSFQEKETDWMSREIALKLMDQKYKIVKSPEFDEKINITPVEVKTVKNDDISSISFRRDETNLNAILDHFKAIADEGDILFSKNEYKDARLKYQEIITSIDNKITIESREKLEPFINSINKRISSALVMEYKTRIEIIDKSILPENDPGEKDYNNALDKYKSIESDVKKAVPSDIARSGMQKIINERQDAVIMMLISIKEKKGDNDYRYFKFNKALGNYGGAIKLAGNLNDLGIKNKVEKTLNLKVDTALTTGRSYLDNIVNSLIDQVEFYNVINETAKAKDSIHKARDTITGPQSKFATMDLIDRYNNCAGLIPGSSIIDQSERNKILRDINSPLDERTFGDEAKHCLGEVVKAGCTLGIVIGIIVLCIAGG